MVGWGYVLVFPACLYKFKCVYFPDFQSQTCFFCMLLHACVLWGFLFFLFSSSLFLSFTVFLLSVFDWLRMVLPVLVDLSKLWNMMLLRLEQRQMHANIYLTHFPVRTHTDTHTKATHKRSMRPSLLPIGVSICWMCNSDPKMSLKFKFLCSDWAEVHAQCKVGNVLAVSDAIS